jgi:ABC-type Fe3+-hydroxamate transport system substrate-binding protein
MIEDIGKLVGKQGLERELTAEIAHGFLELKKKYSARRKIPAAYFIWKNPYMVAAGNTFINDMMNYCGLENVFSDLKRYPEIMLDELVKRETELILLSSEPYPFKKKHIDEFQKDLPGIKIILADGEMFSWYGSRLLKSVDYFHSFLDIL